MHEYHLIEEVIKGVLAASKEKEIVEIILSVSDSSGLDPGSIELYFEEVREKNSRLKGAKLSVRLVKTKLYCPKCNLDFEWINKNFSCPKCSEVALRSAVNQQIHIEKVVFKS
ncbi:MAG: hydrogenase maturation nickel metallochaperone HypA [Candidatus Omnitrophica bacterium]|nr:hydrogenase maturation nickel metallochaperone HypA [Candidatus Omnitrophota bacterium]